MTEFQARKPRVTTRVVMTDGVVYPDMQPLAFGEFVDGEWKPVIEDVNDVMYVGPDTHNKGADVDCLTDQRIVFDTYGCTPCAVNEGAAVGIEYPPAVRAEATTLSFRRAKNSVLTTCSTCGQLVSENGRLAHETVAHPKPAVGRSAKPTHDHDCAGCFYLGNMHDDRPGFDRIVDLYFCAEEPTVIARFGPSGDYHSGLTFIEANPLLMEAYRRAVYECLIEGNVHA